MSFVPIKDSDDATRNVDSFQRTEGSDTVEVQAVAIINPTTGDPLLPASDGSMPVADAAVLAAVNTAAGSAGTGAPALDTGASGLMGWLRKIYGAFSTLGTAALQTAGNNSLNSIDGKLPAAVGGKVPVDVGTPTVSVSGVATSAGQAAIISALGTPLQQGGPVALDTATLAALETINIGNLPADPPTQTTLAAILAKIIAAPATEATVAGLLTNTQLRASPIPVHIDPPQFMRVGFAEVGSGLQGNAATQMTVKQTGAGMAVSQSGGNLVITTGTTTNSETVIRSVNGFSGALLARAGVLLSQRIVNNTFRLEMADLVGEALAFTINSATSVTVSFPTGTSPFTSANVGQSLRLSCISGAAGIPGRFAIASVSGDTVTFTVAAWPASGSGSLTLYGWNYIATEYSGTTATNTLFSSQRRGWADAATTATINTTASPGHVGQMVYDVNTASYHDALVASNGGYQWTQRASRISNVPDADIQLYVFLVVQNGSSAPASTTTLTVGFIQAEEDDDRQKVRISSCDPAGGAGALPVQMMGGTLGTQPVSFTQPALVAGTARVGFEAAAGIWYDDTSTALGAAASFTGTSRDATVTATATAWANAATYAQEIVLSAEQDVSFTLALEVSRDNTNWRRVKAVASAAVTGGGQYSEIVHRPSWRYWRLVVVNGAGAAARTTAGSFAKAL